jgi:DNA-binding beta-propeller fold protein YncE
LVGAPYQNQGDAIVVDRALDAVLRVDPVTGAQTWLSSGGQLGEVVGVTVTVDDRIFVNESQWDGQVLEVDPFTGIQSELVGGLSYQGALGSGPAGELYTSYNQPPSVVRIDSDTGAVTPLGEIFIPFSGMTGLAVEADGRLLVADPYDMLLWRIDPATGDVTNAAFVESIGGIDIVPLPEPAALLQLGCGALALLALRARRARPERRLSS